MNIRRTGLLLLFPLFLFQCTKKDEAGSFCRLNSLTVVNPAITLTVTLEYTNNLLTKQTMSGLGNVQTITWAYDSNGMMKTMTMEYPGGSQVTTFTLDGSNRIASSVTTGTTPQSAVYAYNASGQLETVSITDLSATPGSPGYVTVMSYTYPNTTTGNYSTLTIVTGTSDPIVISQEYDNKKSPFVGLDGYVPYPVNNVTKRTENGVTLTISYQYNSQGYPVSATDSNGSTHTYNYTCQ